VLCCYALCVQVNDLTYIVRAHQLCQEGYQVLWDKFATVWSAPNYCYRMGNLASILEITGDNGAVKHYNVYAEAPAEERRTLKDQKADDDARKALTAKRQWPPKKDKRKGPAGGADGSDGSDSSGSSSGAASDSDEGRHESSDTSPFG
jgi:hypothetical protein